MNGPTNLKMTARVGARGEFRGWVVSEGWFGRGRQRIATGRDTLFSAFSAYQSLISKLSSLSSRAIW